MKCRYCGSMESKVVDSRPNEDSTAIRRRRECIQCGRRFTTFERIEENPIMVVKRDGRRELFEREKIATGIRKACEKRPISFPPTVLQHRYSTRFGSIRQVLSGGRRA